MSKISARNNERLPRVSSRKGMIIAFRFFLIEKYMNESKDHRHGFIQNISCYLSSIKYVKFMLSLLMKERDLTNHIGIYRPDKPTLLTF